MLNCAFNFYFREKRCLEGIHIYRYIGGIFNGLRYATNLKLAKELYDASKPKLKGDQGMIDTFTNTFGLPENSVKLAGGVEAAAAGLFAVFK